MLVLGIQETQDIHEIHARPAGIETQSLAIIFTGAYMGTPIYMPHAY